MPGSRKDMPLEVARQAIDFAVALDPINCGIIFFGGEPLLRKDLITDAIRHCKEIEQKQEAYFHYKVTTNGTLLDEEFMRFAGESQLAIGISHDGLREAHDLHRRTIAGEGTFDATDAAASLLLQYQPYAATLMTVNPNTVQYYADSVDYLFKRGFRYIISTLNYAGPWKRASLAELRRQYKLLAAWYEHQTLEGRKFFFSPFEKKFATHIRGDDVLCQRCQLGIRQVSVSHDGTIYPCVQFVQDGASTRQEFAIGNVWDGIDPTRQKALYEMSEREFAPCAECALKNRCDNKCGCLNWQTTGSLNSVSPVVCESERTLIPIVDRLGARLFRKRAPHFLQKHYNAIYPILSLIDDENPE